MRPTSVLPPVLTVCNTLGLDRPRVFCCLDPVMTVPAPKSTTATLPGLEPRDADILDRRAVVRALVAEALVAAVDVLDDLEHFAKTPSDLDQPSDWAQLAGGLRALKKLCQKIRPS